MALSRKQLNDLLRKLEGPVRRDFVVAIQSARGRARIAALVRAIELGDLDTIMIAAGVREGMWSTLTESIRNVYAVSGKARIAGDVPKTYGMEFDINNPRSQAWLTKNSSGLIWGKAVGGGLYPEQRAAIQTMLTNGMLKGKNPRTTALDIVGRIGKNGKRSGGVLGLTNAQAGWVVNMGDDLQDLNWARYKSRVLRDRRFDGVVKKSMQEGRVLPQAQRNKIVQSYENRMTKYRGDTIARTETLQALNEASDEALRQIVDEGLAPANAVTRIWRHSFAGNERPGHLAMSGQPRGIEEPFTNPITGASLMHPGAGPASEIISCRCFVEHKIDFVAVELAGEGPGPDAPKPASMTSTAALNVPEAYTSFKGGTTMADIDGALSTLGQQGQDVKNFMNQHGTSATFLRQSDTVGRRFGTSVDNSYTEWAVSLEAAPNGQSSIFGAWPNHILAQSPKAGGVTSDVWNFVTVRVSPQVRNFVAKSNIPRIRELVGEVMREYKLQGNFANEINFSRFISMHADTAGKGGREFVTFLHEMGHQVHFRAGKKAIPADFPRLTPG